MSRYEASNERLRMLHGMTMGEQTSQTPPQESSSTRRKSPHRRKSSREHREQRSSPPTTTSAGLDASTVPKKTKFRFKKKHRRREKDSDEHDDHRSRHHHSSKRHKHSHTSYHEPLNDDPTQYDDTYIPNAASWRYAEDQDAAFRESLFDAMADDEGAAFWETIYGQPIHVYERPMREDPKGHLEAMTDDEYAQYVREKMWEKSHQHIIEERERRAKAKEKERQRAKEEQAAWEEEDRRRRRKEAEARHKKVVDKVRERWKKYLDAWKEQMEAGDAEQIPWPVVSGKRGDVTKEVVEEFMIGAPLPGEREDKIEMLELLKAERVRWHPDKAQQRWGKDGGLDDARMKAITVCFQTIDRLHSEWRSKS
ncbi:hypothetical protein EX30DRAFT_96594 [Ascodesmis nigricans]|uniref:Uncharacterized protein n=1 Tax=Ascodesmis nigricans TaxID=341454 RepID=A0A4S2N4J2_9PEZI|nr:hypothetical protein EX30DRAFT_96594 [Ascodesmis nigricans]